MLMANLFKSGTETKGREKASGSDTTSVIRRTTYTRRRYAENVEKSELRGLAGQTKQTYLQQLQNVKWDGTAWVAKGAAPVVAPVIAAAPSDVAATAVPAATMVPAIPVGSVGGKLERLAVLEKKNLEAKKKKRAAQKKNKNIGTAKNPIVEDLLRRLLAGK